MNTASIIAISLIIVTAIIGLVVINVVAISHGYDTQLSTTIAGIISGLVGYFIKHYMVKRGEAHGSK